MSEQECRNDCTMPLRFPRRPGTHFFVGTGEDCFCCEPNSRVSADNRPALPHFNYRIGTYATIREWIFRKINQTPNLQNWTYRDADDPAIALLEGAAILGDILTFYQDFYANEAFLRTATQKQSIADLVRLLGYRLSPGLGGKATFAFEIKKDEVVTIPAGFPVKATLEMVEKPAEFETTEEIEAYPWLSRFNLFREMDLPNISATTNEFFISNPNPAIEIKVGDRLLVGTGSSVKLEKAETVVVDSIRTLHGIQLIKIKGSLQNISGSEDTLTAFKLGRTFHHFGYNGPNKFIRTPDPIVSTATLTENPDETTVTTNIEEVEILFTRYLNGETENSPTPPEDSPTSPERIVSPTLKSNEFPIDTEVQDLPNGVPFIVQINDSTNEDLTIIRNITNVRSESVTWGQSTASSSIVTVEEIESLPRNERTADITVEEIESLPRNERTADIRKMLFHEVIGEAMTIKAGLSDDMPTGVGNTLVFYGASEQAENLKDRRLMFEKSGEESKILSVSEVTTPHSYLPEMHNVVLKEDVEFADFPQENPTVTVYGNLVDADEGKTLPQTPLGNGDYTTIFQTFKLPKAPLTYHQNSESTPPTMPELNVYINGRLWQRVETLFGRGGDEQIYIVREDAENNSWVQFGDGKTGSRLPTGVNNISAAYRIGTGAFGELKADTKVQASAKLKNLDKIQMPLVATGGANPEDGENARRAAPGKIQSLGRLVSLRDFEIEAAAIPGVALASAKWLLKNNVPVVAVTVLMESGRSGEFNDLRTDLSKFNSSIGSARFPIIVCEGKRRYVNITAKFGLDSTFQADLVTPEIERVLGVNFGKPIEEEDQTGLFSLLNRSFGEREYASSIEGKIQNVEGVIWAQVTAFNALSDEKIMELNPSADIDKPKTFTVLPSDFKDIAPCDNSHVLSLFYQHLTLIQTEQEGSS